MRTLTIFTASMALLLGMAVSAQADPTIAIIWFQTSGTGATGGSSIDADATGSSGLLSWTHVIFRSRKSFRKRDVIMHPAANNSMPDSS